MRLIGTILKYLLGFLLVVAVVLAIAYQFRRDPIQPIAGRTLTGDEVAWPGDWSFTDDHSFIKVETRPDRPYSVTAMTFVHDDDLYVTAGGRWGEFLEADPRGRIKVGDDIHPVTATLVTEPEVDFADLAASMAAKYEMVTAEESEARMETELRVFRLAPR